MSLLKIKQLTKNYSGEVTVEVLKGIDLTIEKGGNGGDYGAFR
jgi:ABC-type multidrug transport system ATPase subunit